MAEIDVQTAHKDDAGFRFSVTVVAEQGRSAHEVTVSQRDYNRLAPDGQSPEGFIHGCMRILLERKAQDELMARMDLRDMISFYPEFEEEARRLFGQPGTTG